MGHVRRRSLLLIVVLAAACAGGGDDESATTTTIHVRATTTTAAPILTTTSTAPPPRLPPAGTTTGAVLGLTSPTGVVVPVYGGGPGRWIVGTPCGGRTTLAQGKPIHGVTVIVDAGHGGVETGASGPNGLVEKDLNLVVANLVRAGLEREGATVVMTRTADYRVTLHARAELAQRLKPPVFVSIHHNGGADGPSDRPGTETYYQHAYPGSKRLAGLLYEEVFRVFAGRPNIDWHANVDAGAKYRLNDQGGDYYGILRETNGVTAVITESLFLSASQSEAELLAQPDVQAAEAEAITRAIRRFMLSDDPGSGFVTPIPRETPAGPGGGAAGCKDPPLG